MMRVLVVDDEAQVREGYRLAFRRKRGQWELDLAANANEALSKIASEPVFDIIISEIRMAGMSGSDLLERLQREHPHMLRVVLTGMDDSDEAHRGVVSAHRWLMKPCPREVLFATLEAFERALSRLGEGRVRNHIGAISSLPSTGASYQAVTQAEFAAEDVFKAVADAVEIDPSLSAKLLQIVNSAYFGVPQTIVAVRDAVAFLGTKAIKSIALCDGLQLAAAGGSMETKALAAEITRHSRAVGQVAAALARECVQAERGEFLTAFAGGILHDVGWLALAANGSDNIKEIRLANSRNDEARVFGADHASVGASLLELWGLPSTLVEAVASHHEMPALPIKNAIGAVAAAHLAIEALRDGEVRRDLEAAFPEEWEGWLQTAAENT